VISEEDIRKAVAIIGESLAEFDTVCPLTSVLTFADGFQIDHIPGDEGDEHDTKIELED
jgi:ornithine--oxo-acid transaminase